MSEPASPTETVRAFLSALERLDVDAALTYAAPDIVYQNVPLPPARGIRAFEKQLRAMAKYGSGFEAKLHHIAADGQVVLTERTDVLAAGRWNARFWVCGTFEVRDGRIVLWRDYFDWATVLASSARGGVRALAETVSGRLRRRPAENR
ncbi:limonene-1,2-epoxide hydrolase [Prauserella shujinwangii]|uniref:Limonene-1,2-epoxide hydrolase n=1 Tax=Prauserella shujinwangii TaxID=1453103 RepID=A0A2T0LNA1_9PSEU|nr:limonene-1,2-epoxide hydrolase family protein [Prauserella shujinwangii]PRX44666.1 limonene-1,2-epoxide hydrolase [Prauserella shujinwangii]